jgi:hypothetical protein
MGAGTLTLSLAVAWIMLGAVGATAGEYHYGSTLVCSDCHTMHYSQQHAWGSGDPPAPPLPTGGPREYLLRNQESELCLGCHDGQTFAPDVRGANTGTHVRLAGALTTGAAPYEAWKGHSIGVAAIPPGGSVSIKLQCYNCHNPHGSAYYRNLVNNTAQVTYAKGTNDTTKAVFLRSWTLGNIANNYSVDSVDYNEPDSKKSAMGQFCRGCHTDFHGAQGDSNMGGSGGTAWLRHPTADANIGALGGDGEHSSLNQFASGLRRVKVMSPSGDWGTQGVAWSGAPGNLTPTCTTCHKAHGNQNPFGLILLSRFATTVSEEGGYAGGQTADVATGMRNLCGQCHAQGN